MIGCARVHCGTPGVRAPCEQKAVAEKKEALLQLGARLTGSPRRIRRFAFLSKCCQESNANHDSMMKHLRNEPEREVERECERQSSSRMHKMRKRRRAQRVRENPYLGPRPFESPCKDPAQSCTSPQGRKILPRRTFVDDDRHVRYKTADLKQCAGVL